MSGPYSSSIGDQLSTFSRQAKAYVRRVLTAGGRRFRARMNSERIGGNGSVLRVKSGRLKRSFRYEIRQTGTGFTLEARIGGSAAPYADDHEDQGRLEFQHTFSEEADAILSEIKAGLEVLSNIRAGSGASEGADVSEGNDTASAPEWARAVAQHVNQQRIRARQLRAERKLLMQHHKGTGHRSR